MAGGLEGDVPFQGPSGGSVRSWCEGVEGKVPSRAAQRDDPADGRRPPLGHGVPERDRRSIEDLRTKRSIQPHHRGRAARVREQRTNARSTQEEAPNYTESIETRCRPARRRRWLASLTPALGRDESVIPSVVEEPGEGRKEQCASAYTHPGLPRLTLSGCRAITRSAHVQPAAPGGTRKPLVKTRALVNPSA